MGICHCLFQLGIRHELLEAIEFVIEDILPAVIVYLLGTVRTVNSPLAEIGSARLIPEHAPGSIWLEPMLILPAEFPES